jgi:hypothetical protein
MSLPPLEETANVLRCVSTPIPDVKIDQKVQLTNDNGRRLSTGDELW